MTRLTNPQVLITRPQSGASRFLNELRALAGPFEAVLSPAFENVTVTATIPEYQTAIFTSPSGALFAPKGHGRVAWCVGDTTASAAKKAGYDPRSANGDVDDLLAMILTDGGSDKMAHIRGETSVGNVTARLKAAGFRCEDVVVYRKNILRPTLAAQAVRASDHPVLVPLFSAETVSILADWRLSIGGCHIVAMSDAVADAATVLKPADIVVAEAPALSAMVRATARLIA